MVTEKVLKLETFSTKVTTILLILNICMQLYENLKIFSRKFCNFGCLFSIEKILKPFIDMCRKFHQVILNGFGIVLQKWIVSVILSACLHGDRKNNKNVNFSIAIITIIPQGWHVYKVS